MKKKNLKKYPVLPLRDIVIFPGVVAPLFVGRQKSILALEKVTKTDKHILLVAQKDAYKDSPSAKDIYKVGVLATILQLLKLPDGTVKVLIEACDRYKISNIDTSGLCFQAEAEEIPDEDYSSSSLKTLTRAVINQFEDYVLLNKKINPEILQTVKGIIDPSKLADTVASHLTITVLEKQKILETMSVKKRLEEILSFIEQEIGFLGAEKKIRTRVKKQMEKTQKDYYLNEQMKAIQKELSDSEDGKSEFDEIEQKIKKTKLSKEASEKIKSELKKLKAMSPMSAEASIIRNYIDTVLALPWGKKKKITNDINHAQKILDIDHYGLEKVKERITEYLAVQQKINKIKGPIICLVGPPGVGKTSLAKSIADATNREYTKFSLGGMRDESEIRGHRRTYVGAMPGKILQLLKKAKSSNPVMLLDEVDKLGSDFRGDPSSALLEVLDPEQNDKFNDHYLELDYDLSDTLFIATANSLDIPRPLLDRMEIIRLSGYTEEEKAQIAKQHLIPKVTKNHGLNKKEINFSDDAITDVIRYYTREAGVRNLEKEIAKIARKVVKQIIEKKAKSVKVTGKNLATFLGIKRFDYGKAETENMIGVTTGLAYTEVGGDLLQLEAVALPGKGEIKTTGKLGEVMQESAQAAFSFFKATSIALGVTPPEYQKKNIHLHVPEGATPKDGPSAGVAMFTSIVSVMTGIKVKNTVAMTGEITLRGRVLPIGGLKEKLLAALRGGIKTVLIPKDNEKDLEEMPKNITDDLKIIAISHAEEALKYALIKPVKAVKWSEKDEIPAISAEKSSDDVVTH